jgi:signal transduction histidine kinase
VVELSDAFNGVLRRLDSSLEAMRRFTEDASHEIRNPLAVMRTGLEVLLRKDRPLADYRLMSQENLEEIVRLQSILDGLLLLARAEPERLLLLHFEAVDIARLAREIATRFAIVAAERQISLEVEAPESKLVHGDSRLLQLVLFNLLDNALKHGSPGQPVRLSVEESAEKLLLAVENYGTPVPQAARSRLFERYDRPNSDSGSGVGGLGLSVVRWAARVHGGEARYSATSMGNRFEVELGRTEAALPLPPA